MNMIEIRRSFACFFLAVVCAIFSEDSCSVASPSNSNNKVVLIGASGHKGKSYFQLLKEYVDFVGFIHPQPKEKLVRLSQEHAIPIYPDVESAAETIDFDGAILVAPHHVHFAYTQSLLGLGKFVIKEKPITVSANEAEALLGNSVPPRLFVVVQRQFQSSFRYAQEQLSRIGRIYSFRYEYTLCLKEETSGWRADKDKCLGGVVLDMGYHVVDIVNAFFGVPSYVSAQFSYKTDKMRSAGLEDEAFILLSYPDGVVGNIVISRLGSRKGECFEIAGEHGMIRVDQRSCQIFDAAARLVETHESPVTKAEEMLLMFTTYLEQRDNSCYIAHELKRHRENIQIIEDIYRAGSV